MAELHLEDRHAATLTKILRERLPTQACVYVFSSRATGQRLKPHSDVDLLVDGPVELSALGMADLREALAESALPYSVDLLMRGDASPEFVERLAAEGMIDLTPRIQDSASGS